MAFPSQVAAPTATQFASSVTSMSVNMPASVTAGNRLIATVSVRNSGTWSTIPSGWTQLAQQLGGASASQLTIFEKIATGSEGGTTPTWIASAGTTAVWQVQQISGAHASTPSEVTTASGDATAANPPSETPSWGLDDTLYIAVAGHAAVSAAAFTAAPASYSGFQNNGASTGGSATSVASAYRQLWASPEDPGTFTAGGSNRYWAAATIAIRPVASAVNIKQTKGAAGTASTLTMTWSNNTTTGNLIVVQVLTNFDAFSAVTGVSDSQGNTYSLATTKTTVSNGGFSTYYARNITGGTTPTITVSFSGSGQNNVMQAREYSGLDTSSGVLDQAAGASGNSTSLSATTGTTTNANDLIVGSFGVTINSAVFTAGSGFAHGTSQTGGSGNLFIEDKIVSSTGTQAATATIGSSWNWGAHSVAFKIGASSFTGTSNQTATARIANNRTLTQSATARIATNSTLTQSSTARISQTSTLTQSATARVSATRTLTQSATARIVSTRTSTQSATARIANTRTRTQTSIARIANTRTLTQTTKARIQVTVTKTQTSTARIARVLTKTQSATANIQVGTTLTKTQTATARVANNRALTQSATARIQRQVTKTQTATARIQRQITRTQTSVARVSNTRTRTQTSTARISRTLTKTQTSIARIANVRARTQTATAYIFQTATLTKTQTATARIAVRLTLTQTAKASISQTFTRTQTATARVSKTFTKTQMATARIINAQTLTKTQTATARIQMRVTKTQLATATIIQTAHYLPITGEVSGSSTTTDLDSQTNLAEVETNGTIKSVETPTNVTDVDSKTNTTTVSSSTNKTTVD